MRRGKLVALFALVAISCVSGMQPQVSCRMVVEVVPSDTTGTTVSVVDTISLPPKGCVPEYEIKTTVRRK